MMALTSLGFFTLGKGSSVPVGGDDDTYEILECSYIIDNKTVYQQKY